MSLANGCYGAFFSARACGPSVSGSVSLQLNHALGATPFVFVSLVGSPMANQSIPMVPPYVTIRTTSYVELATNTLSGVLVEVYCNVIHSIIQ